MVTDLGTLQPLIDTIQPAVSTLSLLVGGIFGVYLLLLFFRVYYDLKKIKLLEDIRYDLDQANIAKGLRYSKQKNGFIMSLFSYLKNRSREKKMDKHFTKKTVKKKTRRKK
jgi:hypothetical protein